MRIRNSRPAPFMVNPPEAMPRSTHLRSRLRSQFDDRFLVEEENRRIGWSCFSLRKSICPVAGEDQLHGELEETIVEKRSMNCVNEEKDIKHCWNFDLNLDWQEQSEGDDNKGNDFSFSADSQGDRDNSTLVDITLPENFYKTGESLPLKKRQFTGQFETKAGKGREEEECALVEVEVVDATKVIEDGKINLELEYANLGVKAKDAVFKETLEDATNEVGEECKRDGLKWEEEMEQFKVECMQEVLEGKEKLELRDKARTTKVKMEITNYHAQQDLNAEVGCQKTQSINCVINCESFAPGVVIDDKKGHCREELGLEGKYFEPNGKPRRGCKRKVFDQSDDSNRFLLEMQKPKRGRPRRMQHSAVNGNNRWFIENPKLKSGWANESLS